MKKNWFLTGYRYLFARYRKLFKVMRLTVFFIVFTVCQTFAISNYAQSKKIDLKIDQARIVDVLDKIEDQSDFFFFYNNKAVDLDRKVSLDVKNKTISEILHALFKDTNIEYTINDRQIILSSKETGFPFTQQQKRVTGKVTASSGEPIPGLTVALKGSIHGTITDVDGYYSISDLPINATLVFSYIGLKTKEVIVNGNTTLNVTMEEETIGIDEVVAIGYGTVKRQDLTGSVTTLKNEALTQRALTSVGEAFAGQLAGVQAQQASGKPGAELTIKIRGIGTINASNNPLYVIDGVPCGDNMKDLNSNDIASIEVLKDAASTAIYGARGSSGVVLITTKQGGKSKPTFDFSANYGIQNVDKIIDEMDAYQYVAYTMWYRNEAFVRSGGNLSAPMSSRASSYQYPDSWKTPGNLPNVNWQKEVYRAAPIQNYQLTASGGNDMGSYLVSGSYLDQTGIMEYTGYKRTTLRINTTLNVGKYIRLGMNLAPSFSTDNNPDSEGKDTALHHAIFMPPIVATKQNTEEWGYNMLTTLPNPLERLKETHSETRNNKILSNVWGEIALSNNLKIKSQYGYNFQETKNSYFRPSNVNNGIATYGTFYSNDQYTWSLQNTLNYNPKISSLFDLNVLAGQSIEGIKYYYSNGRATGYPNSLVYTLNVASTAVTTSTSELESAMSSYFGRLSFSAKDKYLLTLNLRRDGSSNFGHDTQWGWFPSASIGWKINKENFMESTNGWLDLLKLRVSVGKTGNNSIGFYNSISMLSTANYSYGGTVTSGLAPSTLGNSNLGWESKLSKDLGLDFAFLRGKIQANFDYYIDDTRDMLQNVPVSYMSGYSSVLQNVGKVRNSGFEFEITTHNIDGQLKWSTSFNISKNTNNVKELGNGNATIIGTIYSASIGSTITKVGLPISSYYLYKTDGLLTDADFDSGGKAIVPIMAGAEKGNIKVVDFNKDGKIDANDKTNLGTNLPDYLWGLTNRFSYRNFDLNVLIQASQGGKLFFLGTRSFDLGANGTNSFTRWVRCYKPSRTTSTVPTETKVDLSWDGKTPNPFGLNAGTFGNDTWLYDASFLRIKSVSLGYTVPKSLCSKLHLTNAKIFVAGDNLFTWNHYPGSSPETNSYGDRTDQSTGTKVDNGSPTPNMGVDYATYPTARKYTLGINLTF
jgi:TonB-linked SusC/RagA family outer membrane protein